MQHSSLQLNLRDHRLAPANVAHRVPQHGGFCVWDCSGLCVSFVALGGTSCRRRRFSLCALVTTTPLPLVPGGMVEESLPAMGVGGFEFLEETQGSVREEEEAEKEEV